MMPWHLVWSSHQRHDNFHENGDTLMDEYINNNAIQLLNRYIFHYAKHITLFQITRYVNSKVMFGVTPVTLWYITPPHHGPPKGTVMVMNDRYTALLFHVKWPSYSLDKFSSNCDLDNPRSRSWVWSNGKYHSQLSIQLICSFLNLHQADIQFCRYSHKVLGFKDYV